MMDTDDHEPLLPVVEPAKVAAAEVAVGMNSVNIEIDPELKKLHGILCLKVSPLELHGAGIKSVADLGDASVEKLKLFTKKMTIDDRMTAMKERAPDFAARIEEYEETIMHSLLNSKAVTKLTKEKKKMEVDVPLLTLEDINQIILYQKWRHTSEPPTQHIPNNSAELRAHGPKFLGEDLADVLQKLKLDHWGESIKDKGLGSLVDFTDMGIEWFKAEFCSNSAEDGESRNSSQGGYGAVDGSNKEKFMNDAHIQSIKKFMHWFTCEGVRFLPNDWFHSYNQFCCNYKFKEGEAKFDLQMLELGLSHDDIATLRARNITTTFELLQASQHWRISATDVVPVKECITKQMDEVENARRLLQACGWLPLSAHASNLLIGFKSDAEKLGGKHTSVMFDDAAHITKQDKRVCRYCLGALLAYILLGSWMITTGYFIWMSSQNGCHDVSGLITMSDVYYNTTQVMDEVGKWITKSIFDLSL